MIDNLKYREVVILIITSLYDIILIFKRKKEQIIEKKNEQYQSI